MPHAPTPAASAFESLSDATARRILVVTTDPRGVVSAMAAPTAGEIVIVDVDPERVRQGRAEADARGVSATVACLNIEEQTPEGTYDTVFCLDVLQRVRDPIQTLDRLIAVCRTTLVVELPGPATNEARNYLQTIKVPWWQRAIAARLPVMLVGRGGTTVTHPESKFYFSASALRHLLVHHRRQFADVRIEEDRAGRIRVVASCRPRSRQLVVVAGPSASGKSHFLRSLENGDIPSLSARLGIDDVREWGFASSNRGPDRVERVVFHYDFLRPWRRDARVYERDEALHLLHTADDVVFVTLWSEPEVLRERIRQRIAGLRVFRENPMRARLAFLRRLLRQAHIRRFTLGKSASLAATVRAYGAQEPIHLAAQEQILELYQQPQRLLDLYERWFAFCGTFRARAHWIVDTTWSDPEMVSLAEWLDRLKATPLMESGGHAIAAGTDPTRAARLPAAGLQRIVEGAAELSWRRVRGGMPTRVRMAVQGVAADLTLREFLAGCRRIVAAASADTAGLSQPPVAGVPSVTRTPDAARCFGAVERRPDGTVMLQAGDRGAAWALDQVGLQNVSEVCTRAVLHLLQQRGVDGERFDRRFLADIAWLTPGITALHERSARLGDLRVIEHAPAGWKAVAVADSLPVRYLQGDVEPYRRYIADHGAPHHTPEHFDRLWRAILEHGYSGSRIVLFGDERFIRDGQHRAAALCSLLGADVRVPVLAVQFAPTFDGWRMRPAS